MEEAPCNVWMGVGLLGLRKEAGGWAPGLREEVSLWDQLRAGSAILGQGRPREAKRLPTGFTSLSRGWRRSLLQSREGRREPGHLTPQLLLPSPSWLKSGFPHLPQEFCAKPQFICEDMSGTDMCQESLGETTEPMLSPQIWQVAVGTPTAPPSASPCPVPAPPSPSQALLSWCLGLPLSTLPQSQPFLPGNSWFLAAAASITLYPRLLSQVVSPGQGFQDGYAGVFRFQVKLGSSVHASVSPRVTWIS